MQNVPVQLIAPTHRVGVVCSALLQLGALLILIWFSADTEAHRQFHSHSKKLEGIKSNLRTAWARASTGQDECRYPHLKRGSAEHTSGSKNSTPCNSSDEGSDDGCAVEIFSQGQLPLFTAWVGIVELCGVDLLAARNSGTDPSAEGHYLLPFSCGPPPASVVS